MPARNNKRKNQRNTRRPNKRRKVVQRATARPRAIRNSSMMGKIAINGALSLKETKKKLVDTNMRMSHAWEVINLVNLDQVAASVDSATDRETVNIFAMNHRLRFYIEPHPKYLQPFYLRILQGWCKGSVSPALTPNEQTMSSVFESQLPNVDSRPDKEMFSIQYDKTIRCDPKNIYDSSSGTSTGEETGLTNDNRANWEPILVKYNKNFNRKFKFDNMYGNSVEGWVPFFAIKPYEIHNGEVFKLTPSSPEVYSETNTPWIKKYRCLYFKDIH